MSSSTTNYDALGNFQTGVGIFQNFPGGVRYPLLEKLRQMGYTMGFFAEKHSLKMPDLSYFLRGRKKKVGRRAKKEIRKALIAEGIVKPPKEYPKFLCPFCGRLMRVPSASSKRSGSPTARTQGRRKAAANRRTVPLIELLP